MKFQLKMSYYIHLYPLNDEKTLITQACEIQSVIKKETLEPLQAIHLTTEKRSK